MPKNRSKSPEEYYRGLLREKEKELRQLRRRVKELEKYDRDISTTYEVLKENEEQLKKLAELEASKYRDLCPNCYKGKMELKITLRGKDYFECNACDHKMNKPSKDINE